MSTTTKVNLVINVFYTTVFLEGLIWHPLNYARVLIAFLIGCMWTLWITRFINERYGIWPASNRQRVNETRKE